MLSLFPDTEIIASETNGPITADVLPTFYRFISMRCAETVTVLVEEDLPRKTEKRRGTYMKDNG